MSSERTEPATLQTASFYRFVQIDDCAQLRDRLFAQCNSRGITGTILLATEGINGTICATPNAVSEFMDSLRLDPRFSGIEHKTSTSSQRTLARLKVKVKPEIIRMNLPGIDPSSHSGEYVDPEDWNALISNPEVVVIDTRNDYEIAIGQFEGARNPETANFSELPDWLDAQTALQTKPAVAMYCTGGIRCEKSTALLKSRGFDKVYHLRGGILNYLQQVPREQSLWQGECFVFDERVSVDHDLSPGNFQSCNACGYPVKQSDAQSCPYCYEEQQTRGHK